MNKEDLKQDCICGVTHHLKKINNMSCDHITIYGTVCFSTASIYYKAEGNIFTKQIFNEWLNTGNGLVFNHH